MKFSDILSTIGWANSARNNSNIGGQLVKSPEADVDRMYQGHHHPYQLQNPYHQQTGLAGSATIGNFYYPASYNMFGQRGYGLKLGSGGGHGNSAPAGVSHSGYGQTGYGGNQHGGNEGGGYDYGHSTSSRHKSKGSSAMTALTLLSFFFFINLLQSCLKEHMDAMNPTVMVMTTGVARNRGNKFKELYRPDSKEIADVSEQEEKDEDHDGEEEREKFTYSNGTHRHEYWDEIKTKLKNNYFKDGSSYLTRIN